MEGKEGREVAMEGQTPIALGSGGRARRNGKAGGHDEQIDRRRGGRGWQVGLGREPF